MSNSEQDLIAWKTDAWKDPGMVAWYSDRMMENTGTNRLKNKVEVALCEHYVKGVDVLDVGIGTGRASLPLLSKGFRLAGTDSSQAMLDECRRLAGGQPVELVPGDVTALPFESGRFDSLISLNVMTHFPHVENVLKEWQRVVKPGGRLIFDIYSLDHLSFSRGQNVTVESLMKQDASAFNMHWSSDEVVASANRLGMRVVALVPYGSVFSGEYRHWHFPKPLQSTNWWHRQLSWIGSDDALLDMTLFLEQEWFACLNNFTTGRYMVVLENERDDAANQRWQANDLMLTRYLASSPVRLDDLASRLNLPVDVWRERFDAHLDRLRNRKVAYFLLTTFLGRTDAISWADLAPRNGPTLQRWVDAEQLDRQLQGFVQSWHQNPALARLCERDCTGLGAGLEYQLQRKVVSRFVQATGGRSE
ncbi:class I SAM-dependent methyltransferase [Paraburkholderia sp. GAS334]|jgi:ubiquinone/menaquinone biosynthesis C-methylase UbiE|uniref:class I SAM-dependent methyltransferase n=1 Tax=Paraburkholderia sp. GAS334 TaxID=3035131 RepID=UPI003D203D9D